MSVMPDHWIQEMAESRKMIEPFVGEQVRGGISYGLSSYGYDFRLSDEYKVFDSENNRSLLNPKEQGKFSDLKAPYYDIPAGHNILGRSLESFKIPREVLALCYGKSTYARCGVFVNITPLEPEWEGSITIAIANTSHHPVRIYANEGIGQVVFIKADSACLTSYADKKGKYQKQKNITVAKI